MIRLKFSLSVFKPSNNASIVPDYTALKWKNLENPANNQHYRARMKEWVSGRMGEEEICISHSPTHPLSHSIIHLSSLPSSSTLTLAGADAYYLDMVTPRVIELSYFQDGMALHVMHVQHHTDTRLHTHDFSELVIVLGGSGVHISPAGDYPIVAGDAFVLHGRQAHGYRNTADLELVNILFRLDELGIPLQDILSLPGYHALFTLEPLFRQRDRFESRLRLSPDELQHAAELVNRMKRESESRAAGWRFATVACFMLLMADLCRYYSHADYPAAQPLLRLGRVLGHLEQHYRDPIALNELAEVGEMSRRTLTREFRRALGCSPVEYLIRLRINRAVALMQESTAGVTDVAFEVGFGDSNYFARQFRAIMGCSPRDFRRRMAAAKVGLLQ